MKVLRRSNSRRVVRARVFVAAIRTELEITLRDRLAVYFHPDLVHKPRGVLVISLDELFHGIVLVSRIWVVLRKASQLRSEVLQFRGELRWIDFIFKAT